MSTNHFRVDFNTLNIEDVIERIREFQKIDSHDYQYLLSDEIDCVLAALFPTKSIDFDDVVICYRILENLGYDEDNRP